MWNRIGGQCSHIFTPIAFLDRRAHINSLQAIASVEETRAEFSPGDPEFSPSDLHTQVQAPTQLRPAARPSARVLLRAGRPQQHTGRGPGGGPQLGRRLHMCVQITGAELGITGAELGSSLLDACYRLK